MLRIYFRFPRPGNNRQVSKARCTYNLVSTRHKPYRKVSTIFGFCLVRQSTKGPLDSVTCWRDPQIWDESAVYLSPDKRRNLYKVSSNTHDSRCCCPEAEPATQSFATGHLAVDHTGLPKNKATRKISTFLKYDRFFCKSKMFCCKTQKRLFGYNYFGCEIGIRMSLCGRFRKLLIRKGSAGRESGGGAVEDRTTRGMGESGICPEEGPNVNTAGV